MEKLEKRETRDWNDPFRDLSGKSYWYLNEELWAVCTGLTVHAERY